MSGCEHKISGSREKIWLPYYFEGRERGLKPHPYCIECGLIKNLSSDKPRSLGYFMNLIAELGRRHKVAKIQIIVINTTNLTYHIGIEGSTFSQQKDLRSS